VAAGSVALTGWALGSVIEGLASVIVIWRFTGIRALSETAERLANRQARARTKGGHTRPLHFQTAAARLLARLTAGREAGPVFLTGRRAAAHRVPATADLDPASGQARLSYEMAGQLFKRYSGGKTLHQLRHSRLTHLGDQNVSAPLLMAISGHKRLATLQRYVTPSQDAVREDLVPRVDPERRRAVVERLRQLRDSGELTTAHVRLAASGLGVRERTVWRWLSLPVGQSGAPAGRVPYQLSEADREAYARGAGNNGPVSTAMAFSFLNAAGTMGG
jgi:integrase